MYVWWVGRRACGPWLCDLNKGGVPYWRASHPGRVLPQLWSLSNITALRGVARPHILFAVACSPCSPIGLLSLLRKTFHFLLVARGPC